MDATKSSTAPEGVVSTLPQIDNPTQTQDQKHEVDGNTSSSSTQEVEATVAAQPPEFVHVFPHGLHLWSILASVVTAYFLVFLDLAVMSTVTPAVTSRFNSLLDIGWYGSAYQLGSSAFTPLSGKIYRYFPLKWSFIYFFVVFELGSALCGAATSSTMFIVGRAIAGLGSSGIFNGTLVTVANVLPLQRRPAVMGINVGIGQLGLALGPIIGGAFTTNASWRWVFYLNLLCAPLVIGGVFLNNIPEAHQKPPPREVLGTALKALDLPGFALVSPAVIMLLLALEYGGNQYAWNSSVVIGLFVGAFATACVFVVWERRQGDGAMIPLSMVSNPVIRSAALTQFFKLAVILIADYYLAIFFQAVQDDSPLMSGVHMLPASFGIVVATMVTGQMTQTTGYWLPWIIAGSVLAAAGYGALSTLDPTTSASKWIGYQVLYGLGAGGGSSSPFVAVQAHVPLKQVPQTMSIVLFAQNLGSSVFLVAANAIFNNGLRKELESRASSLNVDPGTIIDVGARSLRDIGLNPEGLSAAVHSYANAADQVMWLGVATAIITIFCSFGLGTGNIHKMKSQKEANSQGKKAEGIPSGDVKAEETAIDGLQEKKLEGAEQV